jgi:hypothetical protein
MGKVDEVAEVRREVNPEALIALAIEKGLDVESLGKLLSMRRELKEEMAREAYHRDLARFQSMCPIIVKTAIVYNRDRRTVRYKYAPLEDILEQVKELLAECGFSYSFDQVLTGPPPSQEITCTLTHVSGHQQRSTFRSPIATDDYMNETQHYASAITYGKRYTFIGVTGIVTADMDDDAQYCGPEEVPTHGGFADGGYKPREEKKAAPKPREYGPREKAAIRDIEQIINHPSFPKEVAEEAKRLLSEKMYTLEALLKVKDRALVALDKAEILKAEEEEAKAGTDVAGALGDKDLVIPDTKEGKKNGAG